MQRGTCNGGQDTVAGLIGDMDCEVDDGIRLYFWEILSRCYLCKKSKFMPRNPREIVNSKKLQIGEKVNTVDAAEEEI